MSHAESNALYLNEVFRKDSEENKSIFQDNNLLNFDQDTLTKEFLNSLSYVFYNLLEWVLVRDSD